MIAIIMICSSYLMAHRSQAAFYFTFALGIIILFCYFKMFDLEKVIVQ